MPAVIERPVFEEGQILGADDLGVMLDYARNQDARHARCAHRWGIADGLDVKVIDGNLEVARGMAIDSSGAAIILADKMTATPGQFRNQLTEGEDSGIFPLYLLAHYPRPSSQRIADRCGESAGYRQTETGRLQFGRLNALVEWDASQKPPLIASGPDESIQRRVLLGFVEWDQASQTFKSFKKSHDNYRPRYLGVRAETVESATGQLALRVQSPEAKDIALVFVDLLDPKNMFAFGLADSRGGINRVFTVDKDGNVTAKGVIKGAAPLKPGEIYVQSGQATDGVHLPLPAGITLEQVTSGAISLHNMVTPNFAASVQPTLAADQRIPKAAECAVDRETLEVSCVVHWRDSGAIANAPIILPGVCDYLLIATVIS
jgi:hypothetical protein